MICRCSVRVTDSSSELCSLCVATRPFSYSEVETELLLVQKNADPSRSNLLRGPGWFMVKYLHREGYETGGTGGWWWGGFPHVSMCEHVCNKYLCSHMLTHLVNQFLLLCFFPFHSNGCVIG